MTDVAHLLLAMASSALLMGCDPVFLLDGNVKSPSGPLAGAEVTVSCPGDPPGSRTQVSTSDASGRVTYHQIPTISPSCRVIVSKPGFRPREVPVEEICRSHFGLSCSGAKLDVELVPDH